MSCPASAGAAETANGAVERMVLLGLTSRIIPNFAVGFLLAAKDAKIANCCGDYGADEIKVPRKLPRKVPVVPTYYNMWARAGIAKLPRSLALRPYYPRVPKWNMRPKLPRATRDTYPRPKTSLYSRTYTERSNPFDPISVFLDA